MIRLGQKVRDVVTGFTGIADCRMEWMNGCVRFSVQPPVKKGSAFVPESKSFDQEQLEVLVDMPIALPRRRRQPVRSTVASKTGGGRPDPAGMKR